MADAILERVAAIFEQSRPEDYLVRLAASDLGRAYKSLVVSELGIAAGSVVLDLGCGPGVDLPAFADAVGPTGSVLGLDHDATAVARAGELVTGRSNVTVRLADLHSADLQAGSIDRVHTDRVLQHVGEPAAVLELAHRLLRPAGRAVFAEPDWDTLVIDHPDAAIPLAYRQFITEKVVRNPRIGRQLPRLAERALLTVSRVIPITTTFRDAEQADQVLGFQRVTKRAIAAGYLTQAAAASWLQHLTSEPFFASVTLFVVVAERAG